MFLKWLHLFTFPRVTCKGSGFSTSSPILVLVFIIAILVGIKEYFLMVLILISLMTNDVERIFSCSQCIGLMEGDLIYRNSLPGPSFWWAELYMTSLDAVELRKDEAILELGVN